MNKIKVKCHKCSYAFKVICETLDKRKSLKVKCPKCKAIGILSAPLPKSQELKPEPKKRIEKVEAKPEARIKKEIEEVKEKEAVKVKCHSCGCVIEITSKKRPLKVKCPECKAVGVLRALPPEPIKPKPKPKEKIEGSIAPLPPPPEVKEREEEIEKAVTQLPSVPLQEAKREPFKLKNLLKQRIVKPIVIILVIAIILTSVQLASLMGTGETVIVPSDFGIMQEFETAKQEARTRSDEIKEKAESLLDETDWNVTTAPVKEINYNKSVLTKVKPKEAKIFSDIKKASDNGSISYSVGIDYYVFTYYEHYEKISTGKFFAETNNTILNTALNIALEKWYPIDVNGGGDDIMVAVTLQGAVSSISYNVDLPSLQASLRAQFAGGLKIEISKISPTLTSPLSIYFVKPVSYEDKTYVWIGGFDFSQSPQNFTFVATSDNINIELSGRVVEVFPLKIDWEFKSADVNPPYNVNWGANQDIDYLGIFVGYETGTESKKRYQVEIDISPGISCGNLYYNEIPNIKQHLIWNGTNNTKLFCNYSEESLHAEIEIENLPNRVELLIENKTSYSIITYTASSSISKFSYKGYDFSSGQITMMAVEDLPSYSVLLATLTIPPKEEPTPEPSRTIIGAIINRIVAKISAALRRISKTLKSISDTLYKPDNVFHLQPTTITKLEFAILNGSLGGNSIQAEYLQLTGNYIGILNTSSQAGLTNVKELKVSLGRNITFMLKRSASSEPFIAVCSYGNTKILVNIFELPQEILITGNVEDLRCSLSEPVNIELLSRTQNYNLEANLKNISKLTKNQYNFSMEFAPKGCVELALAKDKEQIYKMNENYIYANIPLPAISLKLECLRALELGWLFAVTLAEEYPLKLLLTSNFTSGKILVKNLPSNFNILLSRPLITMPELEELNFSKLPAILSSFATAIGESMSTLKELPKKLLLKEGLKISYASPNAPIIIANLSSGKNPLSWTHGIALMKYNSALEGKMYLELPKNADFVFETKNGLELKYQLESWSTSFNWLTISLETESKKLFAHLQNITKARTGVIKIIEEKPPDVTPPEPPEPLNLSTELFLAEVPQDFNLTFTRKPNLSIVWNASSSIPSIYLNVIRGEGGDAHRSCFVVRSLPTNFELILAEAPKTITKTLAIHEALPELNISAVDKFDFQLRVAGEMIGRKGDYLLYTEGLKHLSIRSEGNAAFIIGELDKLLFQMTNATVGETIVEKLELLAVKLNSVKLAMHSLFGKLPILELTCNVRELQLNFNAPVNTPFGKKSAIALTNFSLFSLNTRKNSVRITDAGTHYIWIAPSLSLLS